MTNTEAPKTYAGGCHCGAVRFEAEIDLSGGASMCNCSICAKLATVGTIVKPAAFRLLAGEAGLSTYAFGMKVGHRKFCKYCGVHVFGPGHLEQLGGDYVSINCNALDDFDRSTVQIGHWDGRHNNWQAGMRPTPWPVKA